MDSEAYLNRIAASNRKLKTSNNNFLSSNLFKILIGLVAALIIVIILGSALDSGETSQDKVISLKVHTTNLSGTISSYQPRIKSSSLRSYTASFSGVLTNMNKQLTDFIATKYGAKDDKSISEKITAKEDEQRAELEDDLFAARINGLLDRTFASKMAHEITIITTREKEIIKQSKNEELKNILETSLNSLDNLYNSFNNYSEAR